MSDEADPDGRPGPAAAGLVEHFFRHEYGRLVAQLANKVGVRHVELVEDAVQSALIAALTAWVAQGLPRDPGAWLYRAACNHLIGALREDARRLRILESAARDLERAAEAPAATHFAGEVRDDLLRMLFVCCDDTIPRDSRPVLALKTLCGFSTSEIALRLFTSEANVHKRLQRARDRLRESSVDHLTSPPLEGLRNERFQTGSVWAYPCLRGSTRGCRVASRLAFGHAVARAGRHGPRTPHPHALRCRHHRWEPGRSEYGRIPLRPCPPLATPPRHGSATLARRARP